MRPGLVSITFRQLSPLEIISLCRANGLQTIEWGGDVHVPHGDIDRATEVRRQTAEAGLSISAYGSYYRLAQSAADGLSFSTVLETAVALGAPAIRVWAGNRASAEADGAWRQQVADDALRCADLASEHGIFVCYEFHRNTLTDTAASALDLLAATEHPWVKTLWQPPHGRPLEECLAGLRAVAQRVHHVHCFHWWPTASERLPLDAGRDRWVAFLQEFRRCGTDPDVLLEFVKNDSPESLSQDAAALRSLLA